MRYADVRPIERSYWRRVPGFWSDPGPATTPKKAGLPSTRLRGALCRAADSGGQISAANVLLEKMKNGNPLPICLAWIRLRC